MYSPISFGQKYDKNGDFIRHFVPELKNFPAKYIYEPWTAPMDVQRKAKCIIGKDYPKPIVDHKEAIDINKSRMQKAYAINREAGDVKKGLEASVASGGDKGLQKSLLTQAVKKIKPKNSPENASPTKKRKASR